MRRSRVPYMVSRGSIQKYPTPIASLFATTPPPKTRMNLSDVATSTPRVLDRCLDLFSIQPKNTEPRSLPKSSVDLVTPAKKYSSHPVIQFFSSVKAKYHFAYHNSKRAIADENVSGTTLEQKTSDFDPFSQTLLLQRLRSYTALNWELPHFRQGQTQLTELFCSSYGWACEPVSRNNTLKNCLKCTSCGRKLVLTFNSLDEQPPYAPFAFGVDDIQDLNIHIKDQYIHQVTRMAHSGLCPWRNVACPVYGTYYLTPHIGTTNETLIARYLALLHKLYTDFGMVNHYALALSLLAPQEVMLDLMPLIKVSNLWLLNRFFKDSKENLGPVLEKTFPAWAYVLAAMGWELHVEEFADKSVPLLVCTMCNQRLFLETSIGSFFDETCGKSAVGGGFSDSRASFNEPSNQHSNSHKSHKSLIFQNESMPSDIEMDCEENALACHKPWCLLVNDFGGTPYFNYFYEMILDSAKNLGSNGLFRHSSDEFTDISMPGEQLPKRKRSIDVKEGLEQFTKLRKLYFADDV